MAGVLIRTQSSRLDHQSLVAVALGGVSVLAGWWWWHRRTKLLRVTASAKNTTSVIDDKHAKKLQVLITQAEYLRDGSDLETAASVYLQAAKLASKYYGKVSMPLFRVLQAYSVVLFALDRPAAVLAVLSQLNWLARRLPQLSMQERVTLMIQLGDALIRTSRDAEAEKVLMKALELMAIDSTSHQATHAGIENAAGETKGNDKSVGAKEDPVVTAHKSRGYAYWNLSLIKSRALSLDAAEDLAMKALKLFNSHFGETNIETLSVQVTLATIIYDKGQGEEGLGLFKSLWAAAEKAFASKSMVLNAFLSLAHIVSAPLVARSELTLAEDVLQKALTSPHLPKLKPLQYYRLVSDMASLLWEAEGREEEAKSFEAEISTTLTGVKEPLPLACSRTLKVVRASLTTTGVFLIDFVLNPVMPASKERQYHLSPEHLYEIRFENPSKPTERIVLRRKVGSNTYVSAHSPLLSGFRHTNNYVIDITVRDKETNKIVGRVRQLVRYVAQFILGPLVPGSAEATFATVVDELKESRKELDRMVSEANAAELAKEEEALTKLLLQLDSVTEEKHREHRKALVEATQALLQRIDAAKAMPTNLTEMADDQ